MTDTIGLTLKIWKQDGPGSGGHLETYEVRDISTDASFLEMLDILNERLVRAGEEPVAFDHDCREGICGTCGAVVNGKAHGPLKETTLCQLHMRHFEDGDVVVIEPWRSRAFTVIKDLVVDRGALDAIIQAGGYISVNTGGAPDANAVAVSQEQAELAMDAAECIGCGACVAACPNGAAMLFTSARVSHLSTLPQGKPEARKRVESMVACMSEQGFGNCGNERECEAACPKGISISHISKLNREFLKSFFK
ncbi:succinate dehydrogenase/fumarate reductase iron-sulfur subunit [Desulfoluna butyratoxydans]|uniref:Alpha-helical ferredoxin n=1 Tax=Desulfoluna butyratoxydans TaxID=231438 RepID=A0A4U8YMY3_9BACT|nr:succinate dehydrogenase/fumarate reductase iron-sulfur subunit [Desulfoluna butyratoxydans]VFQ45425.1 alpha-helical ferredoxin [Desulfoluna butyratoxydans]